MQTPLYSHYLGTVGKLLGGKREADMMEDDVIFCLCISFRRAGEQGRVCFIEIQD